MPDHWGVLLGLLAPVLELFCWLIVLLNLQDARGGRWLLHSNPGTITDTPNGLECGVNTFMLSLCGLECGCPSVFSQGFTLSDRISVEVFALRTYYCSCGCLYFLNAYPSGIESGFAVICWLTSHHGKSSI